MNRVKISESQLKPICSVRELAEDILGLSRSQFYNLQKHGVFPFPVYDIRTRRPYYPIALQKICIHIRRTNIGYNNLPVLFYSIRKRKSESSQMRSSAKASEQSAQQGDSELVETLQRMGLGKVTVVQVRSAISQLYPKGLPQEQGVVLRDLFRFLRQRV